MLQIPVFQTNWKEHTFQINGLTKVHIVDDARTIMFEFDNARSAQAYVESINIAALKMLKNILSLCVADPTKQANTNNFHRKCSRGFRLNLKDDKSSIKTIFDVFVFISDLSPPAENRSYTVSYNPALKGNYTLEKINPAYPNTFGNTPYTVNQMAHSPSIATMHMRAFEK